MTESLDHSDQNSEIANNSSNNNADLMDENASIGSLDFNKVIEKKFRTCFLLIFDYFC